MKFRAASPPPEQLFLKQTVLDAIKLGHRIAISTDIQGILRSSLSTKLYPRRFLSAWFDLDPNSLSLPNFKLS
ncbi:hypothetical protein HID58_006507 [Brassica napus]|uniref:Uncharacterized protein n=1 Tax=Brassica napus TaxID=3708 RepID=A0ABQ8EBK7_BRANA|nr:hypothetical protein HID58_006507 [Brassica napus]